jgi:hypothetical protein
MTWASICEALSPELSSLASAFDAQPPIVAACSPDYQVVEFVLSQRPASPQKEWLGGFMILAIVISRNRGQSHR